MAHARNIDNHLEGSKNLSFERMSLGKWGEDTAVNYLRHAGFKIIARNYRHIFGEIDIVAIKDNTYIFIEVKTRRSARYGHPAEAVTFRKKRQISKAALEYVTRHQLTEYPMRFDVVSIIKKPEGTEISHLESAFEAILY
jgi:putative endonuclease